jgi:hypothetical protein
MQSICAARSDASAGFYFVVCQGVTTQVALDALPGVPAGARATLRNPSLAVASCAPASEPGAAGLDRSHLWADQRGWLARSIVGVSSLAAGHLTLIPQLRQELARLGREDILIVAGGVIPPQDYPALYDAGASYVSGAGTVVGEAALRLVRALAHQAGISLRKDEG